MVSRIGELLKLYNWKKIVMVILLISMFGIGCVDNQAEKDQAWKTYTDKTLETIVIDSDNMVKAIKDMDFPGIATWSQAIITDTDTALKENSKYKVSQKYANANEEFVAAMQDLNSAGVYTQAVAKEKGLNAGTNEMLKQSLENVGVHIEKYKVLRISADQNQEQ